MIAPLARTADELHLLRVVSCAPDERARSAEATRYLERVGRAVAAAGGGPGSVRTQVLAGDPVIQILEAVRSVDPDLVALATHHTGASSGRAYGSVAGQLVRRCRAPSLVVDSLRHRGAAREVRRIVVPFGGATAAHGLPLVIDVARAYGAQVELVHVAAPGDERDADLAPHVHLLVRAGVDARGRVITAGRTGTVAARVVQEAERTGADLVIVTTGGRDGVVRWSVGEVGEGILRACRLPVLVQPRS